MTPEDISNFQMVASHPVRTSLSFSETIKGTILGPRPCVVSIL